MILKSFPIYSNLLRIILKFESLSTRQGLLNSDSSWWFDLVNQQVLDFPSTGPFWSLRSFVCSRTWEENKSPLSWEFHLHDWMALQIKRKGHSFYWLRLNHNGQLPWVAEASLHLMGAPSKIGTHFSTLKGLLRIDDLF